MIIHNMTCQGQDINITAHGTSPEVNTKARVYNSTIELDHDRAIKILLLAANIQVTIGKSCQVLAVIGSAYDQQM